MFDTLSQLVYIFFLKFKNLLMKKKKFRSDKNNCSNVVHSSNFVQRCKILVFETLINSTAILFIQEDEILITRIEFRTFDHESFDRKIYIYIYILSNIFSILARYSSRTALRWTTAFHRSSQHRWLVWSLIDGPSNGVWLMVANISPKSLYHFDVC